MNTLEKTKSNATLATAANLGQGDSDSQGNDEREPSKLSQQVAQAKQALNGAAQKSKCRLLTHLDLPRSEQVEINYISTPRIETLAGAESVSIHCAANAEWNCAS